MKKTPSAVVNRGKPPSVRTPSFIATKQRAHSNLHSTGFAHPNERLLSMSENQELSDVRDGVAGMRFSSKEVTDCMANWLTFLKVLQMLCVSGSELTGSLSAINSLNSTSNCGCKSRLNRCKAMWDRLSFATNSAVSIVRNQTVASLQEAHLAPEIDQDQAEINQGVVCSGLIRLLNLQYQFSSACCEWVSTMSGCSCIPPHSSREAEAVARCFPIIGNPIVPVPQRRWSEAAAAGRDKAPPDPTLRRWSIPWKLALPASGEKSRSTTPDAVWHTTLASQEDLQDVISLLSCRPANTTTQHLPGVILTRADGQNHDNLHKGMMQRGSW
ncbi:uncharacterized protein LOC106671995 isoform X2 [Cimex lectularius]|nr:uncharacterized protein LOC106671995 isoform X2 [Cimex lectularius]